MSSWIRIPTLHFGLVSLSSLTSNGEDHFVPASFSSNKVFEILGRLTQARCRNGCERVIYENRNEILKMVTSKNGYGPTELILHCLKCGGSMTVNMADSISFFHTEQFQKKMDAYQYFVRRYHGKKLVILEFGVGSRNCMIKEPFMCLVASEPEEVYVTFN